MTSQNRVITGLLLTYGQRSHSVKLSHWYKNLEDWLGKGPVCGVVVKIVRNPLEISSNCARLWVVTRTSHSNPASSLLHEKDNQLLTL